MVQNMTQTNAKAAFLFILFVKKEDEMDAAINIISIPIPIDAVTFPWLSVKEGPAK